MKYPAINLTRGLSDMAPAPKPSPMAEFDPQNLHGGRKKLTP